MSEEFYNIYSAFLDIYAGKEDSKALRAVREEMVETELRFMNCLAVKSFVLIHHEILKAFMSSQQICTRFERMIPYLRIYLPFPAMVLFLVDHLEYYSLRFASLSEVSCLSDEQRSSALRCVVKLEQLIGQFKTSNQRLRIVSLQRNTVGLPFSLVTPSRKLIKEVPVKIFRKGILQDRMLWLFSDILVICHRIQTPEKYICESVMKLEQVKLTTILPRFSMQTPENVAMRWKNLFMLTTNEQTVILGASDDVRVELIEDLSHTIADCSRDKKELADRKTYGRKALKWLARVREELESNPLQLASVEMTLSRSPMKHFAIQEKSRNQQWKTLPRKLPSFSS